MAKKAATGVNRSAAIRDLLKKQPDIKGSEAIATLAKKGIVVKSSLFYFVKGAIKGKQVQTKKKAQAKKKRRVAVRAAKSAGVANPVAMILKVKAVAADAGGMGRLKQLVDALAE